MKREYPADDHMADALVPNRFACETMQDRGGGNGLHRHLFESPTPLFQRQMFRFFLGLAAFDLLLAASGVQCHRYLHVKLKNSPRSLVRIFIDHTNRGSSL